MRNDDEAKSDEMPEPIQAVGSHETSEDSESEDKPTETKKKEGSFWTDLPVLIVIAVVVALVVRAFVVQSFWIPSGSMENTLQLDDYVLANKLVYDFRDPQRGEVVVFESPMEWRSDPTEEDFIKRVIGVGGDTVAFNSQDGYLTINGIPLDESEYLYANPASGILESPSKDNFEFEVTIPQGRLWVMGDHRWASGDSRERYLRSGGDIMQATIPVDSVVGKAFIIVWPLDRFGLMTIPDAFDEIENS